MKSNFHSNQILYVKGIGYARLAIDKKIDTKNNEQAKSNESNQQNPIVGLQNEQLSDSVIFCPQMFKIDSDSPFAESQTEVNLSDFNTRKKSMQILRRQSSDIKSRQQIIVPLKLQQCNAMIYCPEPLLMKRIQLNIKSLLQNKRKSFVLSIEITKTIDNLRLAIFKQLGEDIGYFGEVRLLTMGVRMEELNIGSKTIWQCQLKDLCKIVVMGRCHFGWRQIEDQKLREMFVLTNSNYTVANVIKKQQTQTTTVTTTTTTTATTTTTQSEPTNPPQPAVVQQVASQPNINIGNNSNQTQKSVPKASENTQKQQQPQTASTQPLKQKKPQQQSKAESSQIKKLHLQSNTKMTTGIHYWEIKIDRLNCNLNTQSKHQKTSLLIGIELQNEQSQPKNHQPQHIWGFDPIRSKKVEYSMKKKPHLLSKDNHQNEKEKQEQNNNNTDESDEEYGSYAKSGDTVGVLLIIRQSRVKLIFYKNGTCLQECYQFELKADEYEEKQQRQQQKQQQQLKQHPSQKKAKRVRPYLCPFVQIQGDIQLTLQSKAAAPLDSFRFK